MTMDGLLDGTNPEAVVAVAWHAAQPVGFQRYFLSSAGTRLSLDVMPRRRDAPNGVNERLIAETIRWGADHGVTEVSLNFAAFRTAFEAEPSRFRSVIRWGAHRLDPLINVESLNRFNAKFHPTWIPRHVLYRSAHDLPAVLAASLRLEFARHAPPPATD
jgi:lysyl-tRNA synthetase class 2